MSEKLLDCCIAVGFRHCSHYLHIFLFGVPIAIIKIRFNFPSKRNLKCRFIEAITETVNMSDKLGYVYWFAVLVTITCGGATGIFMTRKYKHDMTIICQQKQEFYETYWSHTATAATATATATPTTSTTIMANDENLSFAALTMANAKWDNGSASSAVGIDAKRKNNDGVVGINELVARVNHFDKMFE